MHRRNYRYLAAACVGVFALGAAAGSAATADDPVVEAVSTKDARDLLTEAGVTVDKTEFNSDGFEITGTIGAGRHVWFDGMVCSGAEESESCKEFKIFTIWNVGDSTRAQALAKAMDYNYTSVFADGPGLALWRMDFIQDGVTMSHLRSAIGEFLILRSQAEDVIWPPTTSANPTSRKQR
jgi:hypothetical protein